MSRFNSFFQNNFSGCRKLAECYDPHRNREVSIYLLPGYVDAVGVTDGVDKWVAPVSASLFTVNIQDLLRRMHAGENLNLPVTVRREGSGSGQKRARRALLDVTEPDPAPTRRRLLVDPAPAPAVSTRRKLIIE